MRRGVLLAGGLIEQPVLNDLAQHAVENLCGDLAGVCGRLAQLVIRLLIGALKIERFHKFYKSNVNEKNLFQTSSKCNRSIKEIHKWMLYGKFLTRMDTNGGGKMKQ